MTTPATAREGQYEGTEQVSFPIVCETCLGDSASVRIIRAHNDKECKICARPCTAFRWQPGRKARYKTTVICQMCAKLKNVCQVCLFDLQFGLPVQVRDKFLQEMGSSSLQLTNLPSSKVNRDYAVNQLEKKTAGGNSGAISEAYEYSKMHPHAVLQKLQRASPYYNRNQSRVCSFWLKGECTRGDSCPYRHEQPEHDTTLKQQNIRDRYMGSNDPVAIKMLNKLDQAQKDEDGIDYSEEQPGRESRRGRMRNEASQSSSQPPPPPDSATSLLGDGYEDDDE